jgi:hypothetical protein
MFIALDHTTVEIHPSIAENPRSATAHHESAIPTDGLHFRYLHLCALIIVIVVSVVGTDFPQLRGL